MRRILSAAAAAAASIGTLSGCALTALPANQETANLSAAPAAATGVWDDLAQCESGGNWAINTGNGYSGGLQFLGSTWNAYGGQEFAARAHQASRDEQIVVAERIRADVGFGAWPACSRRLGLR